MAHQYPIKSIEQLIKVLERANLQDHGSIVNSIDLQINHLKPFLKWEKTKYCRNTIIRKPSFELISICWEKNQQSDIHCHGGEECWVKVIEGALKEEIYHFDSHQTLQLKQELLREKGGVSYMNDDIGFHRLGNAQNKRAVTLHLYSKPILKCTVYNEESEIFLPVDFF